MTIALRAIIWNGGAACSSWNETFRGFSFFQFYMQTSHKRCQVSSPLWNWNVPSTEIQLVLVPLGFTAGSASAFVCTCPLVEYSAELFKCFGIKWNTNWLLPINLAPTQWQGAEQGQALSPPSLSPAPGAFSPPGPPLLCMNYLKVVQNWLTRMTSLLNRFSLQVCYNGSPREVEAGRIPLKVSYEFICGQNPKFSRCSLKNFKQFKKKSGGKFCLWVPVTCTFPLLQIQLWRSRPSPALTALCSLVA